MKYPVIGMLQALFYRNQYHTVKYSIGEGELNMN